MTLFESLIHSKLNYGGIFTSPRYSTADLIIKPRNVELTKLTAKCALELHVSLNRNIPWTRQSCYKEPGHTNNGFFLANVIYWNKTMTKHPNSLTTKLQIFKRIYRLLLCLIIRKDVAKKWFISGLCIYVFLKCKKKGSQGYGGGECTRPQKMLNYYKTNRYKKRSSAWI